MMPYNYIFTYPWPFSVEDDNFSQHSTYDIYFTEDFVLVMEWLWILCPRYIWPISVYNLEK